ncbi:unnamed protein product [Paramecium octaurelia]|uniref:VWFA domain-containing protein n=1 Tax=Paramecium octaurelia TaxID=43137 RepID=A0A8S1TB70_PAROT|nr:unnamed protein product [Paramecium octaurelia]CAD8149371.1 unnamed protein product [Paramecium octaurelia]CAD8149373.1 unnamed protein product [Paramecium octaurelia]
MININSQQYPRKIQVQKSLQNKTQLHQGQQLNCFQYYKIAQQTAIQSAPNVMNPYNNQLLFITNGPVQQVQLRKYRTLPDQYAQKSHSEIQKITYNDDEMIQPKKYTSNQFNLNEKLSFEVKALYKMGKLLKTRPQYLPGIVSIKAEEETIIQKQGSQRVGVDLICLIDISGSMVGVKIEMVKASLIVLLKFLGDNDRLQLITFDDKAHRLTPLKIVTKQNKSYFIQIIKQIQAFGDNNISKATKMAFSQLKGRKYVNNVTSVFLLSDGVDSTYPQVKEQIKTVNEGFTLHTFGFGEDHDAKMMAQICNLKSGSFYFVQDVTLLDEFFADALGGLISVVGEQLEITLQSLVPQPYQDIQISKTYGNMWQKKGNQYYITQPQLASGTRKDYVFELALPKFEGKIEDNQRNVKVIDAVLKIKDPINGTIIMKQTSLTLTFFNQDEQINYNESDIDVYAQYYRVKGTEVIDDARKACELNKNEDAQKLIDNMLIQIQKNQNVASKCTGIIQDLQQAKQASARNTYNLFGQKQMCQMVSNNYQQGGINSLFSATGMQQQQLQPAAYSNACQQQMMYQVQASKPNYKPS